MRVLHVVNGEHVSGPERVVDGLVRHAHHADPLVVSLMRGEYWRARRPGVLLCASRGRGDLSVVPRLARLIRAQRVDIVHTHTVRANLVGRLAAQVAGRPAVDHVHSPSWMETTNKRNNRLRALVDDRTRRLSRLHISVSQWLGEQLLARGYPAERIVVCANGIDIEATRRQVGGSDAHELRAGLDLPDDVPLIGMYAMFRPRKGADVLLRAFARSRSRERGARLLLVGGSYDADGGAYLDVLKAEARRLGIADRCIFTGFQASAVPWMAAASIGVIPSLFGEGLPISLLEQLAVGLPTVASDAPGIAEVAAAGRGVQLVPAGDEVALSETIDRVLASDELRRSMADGGAAIAGRYTLEGMARCVERAYERVAKVLF